MDFGETPAGNKSLPDKKEALNKLIVGKRYLIFLMLRQKFCRKTGNR